MDLFLVLFFSSSCTLLPIILSSASSHPFVFFRSSYPLLPIRQWTMVSPNPNPYGSEGVTGLFRLQRTFLWIAFGGWVLLLVGAQGRLAQHSQHAFNDIHWSTPAPLMQVEQYHHPLSSITTHVKAVYTDIREESPCLSMSEAWNTLILSKWTEDPCFNASLGHGSGFERATCLYDDHEDALLSVRRRR